MTTEEIRTFRLALSTLRTNVSLLEECHQMMHKLGSTINLTLHASIQVAIDANMAMFIRICTILEVDPDAAVDGIDDFLMGELLNSAKPKGSA